MERYKKCLIKVNNDLIKRHILFKFGSIENYLKFAKISRVRLWKITNQPHLSKDVECLQKLAKDLELSIDDIIM